MFKFKLQFKNCFVSVSWWLHLWIVGYDINDNILLIFYGKWQHFVDVIWSMTKLWLVDHPFYVFCNCSVVICFIHLISLIQGLSSSSEGDINQWVTNRLHFVAVFFYLLDICWGYLVRPNLAYFITVVLTSCYSLSLKYPSSSYVI